MADYVGRFAPSPTGPLHAGSLLAALASWLDARAQQGRWLLRIEDIDAPRCDPRHAHSFLSDLAALGLHWDGEVCWQSRRESRYQEAFEQLCASGQVFGCACSRRELRTGQPANGELWYPGTCRQGLPTGRTARSWRFRVEPGEIAFVDRQLGEQRQEPARQCGDFVIRRREGFFAYQLAVVIDDADHGVTQVVRGADLLASTGRQIALQRALGLPQPIYLHLPLLCHRNGDKLSKQSGADAIDLRDPARALRQALRQLGQDEVDGSIDSMLDAAISQWRPQAIPRQLTPL